MKSSVVKIWDSFLLLFPYEFYDVYFEEKYVKLYETEDNEAVCFIYEEEDKLLLFPFLRRAFYYNEQIYCDFETAYGYGGPICNVNDIEFKVRSLNAFKNYCISNNFIAGFVRFHPLLNNHIGFPTIGKLLFDRHTIAMDLSLSEDEIWMNEIHTQNRNTIKKGKKSGLVFIVDKEYNYLNDFIRLYNKTMEKVDSDSFFYFKDNYYNSFKVDIKNSFLGLVSLDEKIISGAIFFYSKEFGHYHLSGSDSNYLFTSPNNFMLYEASKIMKSLDVKKFHLGGGLNSDEKNSLYQFKSKFSKSRYDFYIGKAIINQEIYDILCKEWSEKNPEKHIFFNNYLLKYKY